jgi:hypothetical protein
MVSDYNPCFSFKPYGETYYVGGSLTKVKVESKKEKQLRVSKEKMHDSWRLHNYKTITIKKIY